MKIIALKILSASIILVVLYSGTASGESVEDLICRGDLAFNQEKFKEALALYQQASGMQPPPQHTEIINNIAAVNMATGNLEEFHKHFTRARDIKQLRVEQTVVRQAEDNLLINGGFEDGLLFPWGTGHYERTDGKFKFGIWWNSNNAKAFMKIDTAEKYSGNNSLLITNYSQTAPHVFTTFAQRISGLRPNTVYKISCHIKAKNLAGGFFFTVDAAWVKNLGLPSGTYDWQFFSRTINIGHNDYIDFRIVHQNTGSVWLDDIVIEEVTSPEEEDILQRAERLFDSARYEASLNIYLELEKKHQQNKGTLRYIRHKTGQIYLILGRYDQALENLSWAVDKGLSRANIDLAELYYYLGDYETAERYFAKSLEIVKEDQGTKSLVWNKASKSFLAKGDLDRALQAQQYSYHILKHIEDKHGQALSLNQLGVIYQRKEQYENARAQFLAAQEVSEQLDDKNLHSDILLNLAETAYLRGRLDEAREHIQAALQSKEALLDQVGLVKGLHLRGRLDVAENKLDNALPSYRRAVALLEAVTSGVGDISRETKATFLNQFSRLYREYVELLLKLSQRTKQAGYHQEAFQVAEQARSRIFTEMVTEARAMQAFFTTNPDPEFRKILERERLLRVEIHALEKQRQQAQIRADLEKLRELEQRLADAKQARHTLGADLSQNYPRYADLKTPKPLQIGDIQKLLDPDEAALSYFVTSSRTALWAITRENAEFVVIPFTRDELIKKSEAFRKVFSDIAEEISQFDPIFGGKEQLKSAFTRYNVKDAYDLYTMLVSPVERLLHSKKVVYLAPDDLLYKLPFEALVITPFVADDGENPVVGAGLRDAPFWVRTHNISYVPSLSVLRSLRTLGKARITEQAPFVAFADPAFKLPEERTDAAGTAQTGTRGTRSGLLRTLRTRSAVTGDMLPPLPDTRSEAISVAGMLGADPEKTVYLQERASEHNVKQMALNRYKTVLFATHGLLSGEFGPGTQPALALSFVGDPENDGLLEMGEILGLDLNADLIVLSACNTASGSGEEDHGEGFAGLTRSFMYAGARSLFVTQWSVESSSAKRLVQSTFAKAKKRSKSDALTRAKRELIASEGKIHVASGVFASLAHPFFWAPYILVGEAK